MNRTRVSNGLRLMVAALAVVAGCKGASTRPYREPPPPGIHTTDIDYVDTDGFDALFETALVNQDPVIVIHTRNRKPDWGGRLNAWIAAWNMGGQVAPPGRTARGQAPVAVDGDSIREFRLLVDDLMDRAQDLAKSGAAWWAEERVRSRRVALLKPYNLRFHMEADRKIQLVFFNGNYSRFYPEFVQSLTGAGTGEAEEWSRTVECSRCKHMRDEEAEPGHLTGRSVEE